MRQYSIKPDTSGDHYGVSSNTYGSNPGVLVQLQEHGEQVRLQLTVAQARHMIDLLQEHTAKVEMLSKFPTSCDIH